jgi:hypothetical protein
MAERKDHGLDLKETDPRPKIKRSGEAGIGANVLAAWSAL